MSAERLQKVLAQVGVGSRRKVEELIREGRITVDGKTAELGQRVDLATEAVKVDGRRILPPPAEKRYILLNKPRACVSTVSDPEGRRTVLDVLPPRLRHGLKPVGRLDYDTEGLLILTDDGDFAHRVAHPRFGCHKTYEVKVSGRPTDATLARLRAGVPLEGRRLSPVSVEPRGGAVQPASRTPGGRTPRQSSKNSWWTVVLSEGRTRQIREMFFRVGHPVQRLRRVAIGPLRDPRLTPGSWRELDPKEVAFFEKGFKHGEPGRKKPASAGGRGRGTSQRPGRAGRASSKASPKRGGGRRRRPSRRK